MRGFTLALRKKPVCLVISTISCGTQVLDFQLWPARLHGVFRAARTPGDFFDTDKQPHIHQQVRINH